MKHWCNGNVLKLQLGKVDQLFVCRLLHPNPLSSSSSLSSPSSSSSHVTQTVIDRVDCLRRSSCQLRGSRISVSRQMLLFPCAQSCVCVCARWGPQLGEATVHRGGGRFVELEYEGRIAISPCGLSLIYTPYIAYPDCRADSSQHG